MPVVGRGDGDHVDVVVFEDLTHVLNNVRTVPVLLLELAGSLASDLQIRIDERRNLHVLDGRQAVHVALAPAVDTEHSSPDAVVGPQDAIAGCKRGRGRRCCCGLNESSSLDSGFGTHYDGSPVLMLSHRDSSGQQWRSEITSLVPEAPKVGYGTSMIYFDRLETIRKGIAIKAFNDSRHSDYCHLNCIPKTFWLKLDCGSVRTNGCPGILPRRASSLTGGRCGAAGARYDTLRPGQTIQRQKKP